jgi:hypothetical protein
MTSPDSGPRSPDSDSFRNPDYIEGLPEELQIDRIDELREAEGRHVANAIRDAEAEARGRGEALSYDKRMESRSAAIADFESMITHYLQGVFPDKGPGDAEFDRYLEVLRECSIDRISPKDWETQPLDPDSGDVLPSERMKAVDALRSEFSTSSDADDEKSSDPDAEKDTDKDSEDTDADKKVDPADVDGDKDKDDDTKVLITPEAIKAAVDSDPAVIAARANVETKRDALAALTAQRQGRLLSFKSTKVAFEEAQREYNEAVIALTKLELEAEKAAGHERDEEAERLDAVFKLIGQYQELQNGAIEILKNKNVTKVIEWLTSGSVPKRILKGAAVSVGVGLLAAALPAIGGGAVLGTTAVVGGRLVRAYARSDARAGRGMDVVDANRTSEFSQGAVDKSKAEADPSTSLTATSEYLMKHLSEETAREQGKRRKATVIAMGVAAVGATAGWALHEAYDSVTSSGGSGVKLDHDDIKGGGRHVDKPSGGVQHPEVPGDPKPNIDWNDAKWADARTISPGEGMYQTFHDMNIPEKDWSSLMDKVGPDLHNMQDVNGNPLAYRMPNGDWGLHMTPDGKLPTGALDAINNAHEHMQGTGSSAETVAYTTPSGASHIDTDTASGTGVSAEVNPVDINPASPEDLQHSIDHSQINDLIANKETLTAADITGNQELMDLSHVATYASPDVLGRRLGLSATEWNNLNSYIIEQVRGDNRLYTNAFSVDNAGYLRFTQNRVPANTMAAILSRIPMSSRNNLVA